MKKIFYFVSLACILAAFNSCNRLETDNPIEDDPLYEYYKPLIGEWTITEWYGVRVNENGVEEPFDLTSGLENGLYTYTLTFDENKMMAFVYSDSVGESTPVTATVSFTVDVRNYFTAKYSDGTSSFFQIVKSDDTSLQLKEDADGATYNYHAVKAQ